MVSSSLAREPQALLTIDLRETECARIIDKRTSATYARHLTLASGLRERASILVICSFRRHDEGLEAAPGPSRERVGVEEAHKR